MMMAHLAVSVDEAVRPAKDESVGG